MVPAINQVKKAAELSFASNGIPLKFEPDGVFFGRNTYTNQTFNFGGK
jgi:hypothetical protein